MLIVFYSITCSRLSSNTEPVQNMRMAHRVVQYVARSVFFSQVRSANNNLKPDSCNMQLCSASVLQAVPHWTAEHAVAHHIIECIARSVFLNQVPAAGSCTVQACCRLC